MDNGTAQKTHVDVHERDIVHGIQLLARRSLLEVPVCIGGVLLDAKALQVQVAERRRRRRNQGRCARLYGRQQELLGSLITLRVASARRHAQAVQVHVAQIGHAEALVVLRCRVEMFSGLRQGLLSAACTEEVQVPQRHVR